MSVHFYTTLEFLDALEQGKIINVWNKSEAKETDIHISFDLSQYNLFPTGMHNVFNLGKRIWLER